MNREKNNMNTKRHAIPPLTGFCSVHPPGGLVMWPNGHTTRIGHHRVNNTGSHLNPVKREAFVAWPNGRVQPLRA